MPAKPTKTDEIKDEEVQVKLPQGVGLVSEPSQRVKTIVRHMADEPTAMPNPADGLFSAKEIDDYLSAHYELGFRIHSAFYFGRSNEGGHVFCYLLVNEGVT